MLLSPRLSLHMRTLALLLASTQALRPASGADRDAVAQAAYDYVDAL